MSLEDFIMQMRQLGELPDAIAAEAAPVLEKAARENVAAGKAPNGERWQPKKDGSAPLVNAEKSVHATAAGPTVTLSVEGVEAWHQRFKDDGHHPKRQLIPVPGDQLPEYLAKPLGELARATIAARLGGT